STVISAFNSLTLSPALTALLLRPQDKETALPLPTFAFPLIGFWIGWEWISPWVAPLAERLPVNYQALLADQPSWVVPAAVGLATGIVLWLVSRPLNLALRALFRGFNASFNRATDGYTRAVAGLLRVSFAVIVVYAGLLVLTWFGFDRAPKGFIP